MQTYEILVAGGRKAVDAIRWELFLFEDVRDVLATNRSDSLTVVFRGEPRPVEWREALRSAGYDVSASAVRQPCRPHRPAPGTTPRNRRSAPRSR